MSGNVVSHQYLSKTEEVPKLPVPGGTPHLRHFGVDHVKSKFDSLNKKQSIDGWTIESRSIAIFVTKYHDLLYLTGETNSDSAECNVIITQFVYNLCHALLVLY